MAEYGMSVGPRGGVLKRDPSHYALGAQYIFYPIWRAIPSLALQEGGTAASPAGGIPRVASSGEPAADHPE